MSEYRNQLENYLQTLNIATGTVYDVGGADLPITKRVNSWAVDNYKILDLPEFDFNISTGLEKEADVVFCLELMEYIYDPVTCIDNLWYLLIDGGILYITFPFIYPVHQPKEYDYLRYTKQGAIKLLNEAGFKILDVIPRTMTLEGQRLIREFRIAEGMHAAKGVVHNELGVIIKAQKI